MSVLREDLLSTSVHLGTLAEVVEPVSEVDEVLQDRHQPSIKRSWCQINRVVLDVHLSRARTTLDQSQREAQLDISEVLLPLDVPLQDILMKLWPHRNQSWLQEPHRLPGSVEDDVA